ncbi:PadR family transcriptional regulator [Jeotgalibacillus terrae]|uniref:PadR family transcriptional regulator n=1 Tax=Jeotgalibacillus terrae TaxID=587735 RepID=A0ABW5ZKL0_9BACL|nr:PadR family transcriptional regulator [Jeotgalibacillus terrae]MBM7578209.1 DNA-binding PadR family transcriptional regulator [Jeotgalibacillus terrae]
MSVKYGILTLLFGQNHHGYELKKEIDSLLSLKGKVNPGQIYTTLDRLIRDQLVTSPGEDDKDRKLYKIEPNGKKELEMWLLEPVSFHSSKDDFFLKWSCARKIHYPHEQRMIERQKATIIQQVMELTKLKTEALMDGNEETYLLLSGTLLHLEADLNWLNQVENRNRS